MPGTPSTAWQPLRILTFYRLILAGLLCVLYFALRNADPFNVHIPTLFQSTLVTYLVFSVAIGFATRLRWPSYAFQSLLQILVDIGAIALLMHATGGVTSSLAVLLVIAVAVGALILPGRTAYLFAAIGTLALLFETGLASLEQSVTEAGDITRAGLLGTVLFATAGLAHVLAMRIRESEALAQQRGVDLANLEQLNQYIIQQLQPGVLVVDPDNKIRLANDTARTLLGLEAPIHLQLEAVAPALSTQLQRWKHNPDWQAQAIDSQATGSSLMPRFSAFATARGHATVVLLEDSAQLAQQTQQLKLASLGRLTASIAHEIRNPLGAISHAAQLLGESEQLNPGDKRLTEIIHNHTQRMNSIIENVLQLSRRAASQPQAIPLRDWLAEFHKEFVQTEEIADEQLQIDIEPQDLALRADPGQLHQVLTNLCQNAFRHAGRGLPVQLQVRKDERETICIDVIDEGPGIDADTADQMFEPFYTTASSGTGLGLYIARELCEINQARLSYQPTAAGKSCFRIRFTTEPVQG